MRKVLLAFVVMLIPLLTANVTDAEESTTTMYLRAAQHEQAGEYDKAMALYRRILVKEDSPTVLMKMYDLESKRNNRAEADRILTEAYRKYPQHATTAFFYGVMLTDHAEKSKQDAAEYKKLYMQAAEAFQNAADAEPSEQNYVALAIALTEAGEYKRAEDCYKKLIDEFGLNTYYRSIAAIKLAQGQRDQAVADLERAIRDSDDVQAYLMLADIYLQEDNAEKAMQYLQKVASLRPELSTPNLYLAEYYRDAGNYEKAVHYYSQAADSASDNGMRTSILRIVGGMALENDDYIVAYDAFTRAIEATPSDQQLYYFAGFAADMLDDYPAARNIYEKGLELFPDYSMLRKRLAINYIYEGKPDKAIDALKNIDELEQDVQYYMILSNAYEDKNDMNAAIAALQKGIDVHVYNTNLFVSLAMLYEQEKRYDECIALLKQALKYEPESPALKNFLGYLYADLNKNLAEAYVLISEALKAEPDNYAYLDSMAWVYYRQGDIKKAHEWMLKAMAINPEDPELIKHMEEIERALK